MSKQRWRCNITLHKDTLYPKHFKHYLYFTQFTFVAILRGKNKNSITTDDAKRYKVSMLKHKRSDKCTIPVTIQHMDNELRAYLKDRKPTNSYVALAVTKLLDEASNLPSSKQDALLNELVKEYRAYVIGNSQA